MKKVRRAKDYVWFPGHPRVNQLTGMEVKELKDRFKNCPKCKGSGIVAKHSKTGEPGPFRCLCRYELIYAYALKVSRIPKKYHDFDMEDFDPSWAKLNREALTIVNKMEKNPKWYIDRGRGLFLYGGPGTGKTAAACIIGKSALVNVFNTYYTTTSGLISRMLRAYREAQRGDEEELERVELMIAEVDLLIIDEVDKVFAPSDGAVEAILHDVFGTRYENQKSVIAIANTDRPNLHETILDRFSETMAPVEFLGGSVRKSIGERAVKENEEGIN